MEYQVLRNSKYSLNELTVNGSMNELGKAGLPAIKLQPRLVSILTILASEAGKVVPRERIIREIWSDYYTGDLALNQSISRLRKALKEVLGDSEMIQTVAKGGYVLNASVSLVDDIKQEKKKHRLAIAGTILLLSLLTGGYLFYLNTNADNTNKEVYKIQSENKALLSDLTRKINDLKAEGKSYNDIVGEVTKMLPDSVLKNVIFSGDSIMIFNQ